MLAVYLHTRSVPCSLVKKMERPPVSSLDAAVGFRVTVYSSPLTHLGKRCTWDKFAKLKDEMAATSSKSGYEAVKIHPHEKNTQNPVYAQLYIIIQRPPGSTRFRRL